MSTQQKHAAPVNEEFPKDWPVDGPIDLRYHDLPHLSSTTEWWYVNSHLKTTDGKDFSMFASFFRKLVDYDEATEKANYAYSLTFGVSDVENKKYSICSLIDPDAPAIGLQQIKDGKRIKDPLLRRAGIELLEKGKVPRPDILLKNDPIIHYDKLHLDFDGNRYFKLEDGRYQLELLDPDGKITGTFIITLKKPPIRHGDNGVVRGVSGEDMFYYFIPRCGIEGSFELNGETHTIDPENSSAWYDHEFGRHQGGHESEKEVEDDIAWNWISTQLDNGSELTAYCLYDMLDNEADVGKFAVVIDPDGTQHSYTDLELIPRGKYWTSMKTFNDYPTQWTLKIPGAGIELEAEAAFEQQEFMTVISKPAFWEGRMSVKGTMKGKPVEGPGFVERHGFTSFEGMNDFFKAVGKKTRESVEAILPFEPNDEETAKLVSSVDDMHFLKGIDKEQFSRTMIKPIREIIDRGGKAWRSYMPLACCDVVGGDSQDAEPWLALPELLHVGSLIVDDVEDKSDVRRGGKPSHLIYGEATAINAGTACYFIGQDFIYKSDIPLEEKLDIYNLYFRALRAAHAGQAIDIDGFASIMPQIVENGNGALLEERVLAIHLLKAAVPASFLGRMGVILGKGTEAQMDGVGEYLEAVGMAFQIIDDVLNLRGFKDNLKAKGEDIMHGKITMPLAKAMGRISHQERHEMWVTVASKPTDQAVIDSVVANLEKCGALQDCITQATEMVEEAWHKLDDLVPDSFAKLMLRSFGWFVLEREY